ncbi:MAG TPA: ImmA/IrrE family metallo-endopeptidase [Thermoanaerobaculia bacterium]|nr:ImmA/IrrE family metallo-endopeptidase [Thermoanaerobaculia bacterium]
MRVEIKPQLLTWARERSMIENEVLENRFPKLHEWESGERKPTLKQLENFAQATHTPVGYFFLDRPPVEEMPVPDFRTMHGERRRRPSADLLDAIYLCQQRQDWYREFARSIGERPRAFAASLAITENPARAAATIRDVLGFEVEERRRLPTWTDALRKFVELADAAGILVMVSGVVGSNNHRKLDPEEFRGFALADPIAPLVFVNGSDTKAAQMFTLAHEIAHIFLGQSAVSDAQPSVTPEDRVERWCNQVAAELLVPAQMLRDDYDERADIYSEMQRLARRFKVSTLVVLRRIFDIGGLTLVQFRHEYEAELRRLLELPVGSGGNFYLTLGARASKRFARALVVSTLEGQSSFTEALRLLGFKRMSTFRELGQNLGLAV